MKTGNDPLKKRTLKQKQNCERIGRSPQVLSTFPSIINFVCLSFFLIILYSAIVELKHKRHRLKHVIFSMALTG